MAMGETVIPEAVRRAAAEAEQLEDQVAAEEQGQPAANPMEVPPITEAGIQAPAQPAEHPAPPKIQAPRIRNLRELVDNDKAEASKPTPPSPAMPARAPLPGPVEEVDPEIAKLRSENELLRQQFSTLQGKYNSEVPRQAEERQEMKQIIQRLEKQNEELMELVKNQQEADWRKALPEDQRDEFETVDEALGISGKTALSIAEQNRIKSEQKFEKRLQEILEKQEAQAAETRTSQFWAKVDQECPGASTINQTQEFMTFMQSTDPVTGMTYQERGVAAMQSGNHRAVAQLFKEYKKQAGLDTNLDEEIESQVRPAQSRATGAPGGAAEAKPIIYKSQVEAFYKECATGVYGPDPEMNPTAQQIQQKIEEAVADNRFIEDV